MKLQMLKSFLAVAQCRSFTKAAQYLNFTQPSISNHIASLEAIYGITLLVREGKNVYLTEAGKAFIPFAEKMLADFESSVAQMEAYRKNQDRLKIAVSTQFINYYLLDILQDLRRSYPNMEIDVHLCMDLDDLVEETFVRKNYDLAFVHMDIQPLDTRKKLLWKQKITWVASAGFAAKNPGLNIYRCPFIGYREDSVYYKTFRNKVDFSQLDRGLAFNDSETVIQAVKKGMGISLVPEIKVAEELAAGTLVSVAPQYDGYIPLSMLVRCEMELTPSLSRFIDLVMARRDTSLD